MQNYFATTARSYSVDGKNGSLKLIHLFRKISIWAVRPFAFAPLDPRIFDVWKAPQVLSHGRERDLN